MNHDPSQPTPDGPASSADDLFSTPAVPPSPQEDEAKNVWFDSDQPVTRSRARPRSMRAWIAGGVTAILIAGGTVFGINAISSHSTSSAAQSTQAGGLGGGGMGTRGTITAVNGSTITVKTTSGTTKVTTSAATAISVAKSGKVTDIATGDHITVMGTTSGTKITATQIVDRGKTGTARTGPAGADGNRPAGGTPPSGASGVAPSGGMGRGTDGTVTKVDGSTITVKGADGKTYTVASTSTTAVTVESTGSLSSLASGDSVQVMGQTSASGAVTATRVVDGASSLGTGGTPPAGSSTGSA